MNKIKVLHIIKSLGRGGAEMLLPETLKIHNTDQFEFHYIYFLPWKNQMVSAIEDAGGKVTCLSAANNIKLLQQLNEVVNYCQQHKINLIHCHLPWAGFLGRMVYFKTKIPTIYSEHNMQERYHFVTKLLNRLSFNCQSLALGVSEDVTTSIKKNIPVQVPVRTLLNGANTSTFRRDFIGGGKVKAEMGIPGDAIVIGNVAVFRFQKRLVEWLKVFKKIELLNPNIYGLIVGAGPLEEEIKVEVAKLNLEKKIFFPGLQANVKPYFSVMDIFMMSSSFEGLPIALLEAMSMECAIVATDAGGIKEVIRHKKDGLICKVEEWEKLSDLCMSLISDPKKLSSMKTAARQRVVDKFSLVTMVDSLEDIYRSFIPSFNNP